MATSDGGNITVIDALALGQIERASLLLSEGSSLDHQRAAEVVIDKDQYEALKLQLSNYKSDVDKHFLLHRALVAQQEDIAKLLVESGADVNKYDKLGLRYIFEFEDGCAHYSSYLPLQLSLFCSLDMTRFLLESGADVNKGNLLNETVLLFACTTSVGVDRVAFLLDNGANIHAKDCSEGTGLHCAATLGKCEVVRLLIEHGADIEAKDNCRRTALIWACTNSANVNCLNLFLEKGADCKAMGVGGCTGLMAAAKSGNAMAVKLLTQCGAQLEARTLTGDTALMLACEESVPAECVRTLLENGSFPNVKNRAGNTPLDLANEEKIRILLQYGATQEELFSREVTELIVACASRRSVGSILNLLQNNASPNVKNYTGQTALHKAADKGDIETLKVLVQYKADVNAMTDTDQTSLMFSCANSCVHVDCLKFLLENKALPNLTDTNGVTALHLLMGPYLINWERTTNLSVDDWRARSKKIKLLVEHGADLEARTPKGETPFLIAVVTGNLQVIELLHDLGADVCAEDTFGENAITTLIRVACKVDTTCDKKILQFLIDKGVSVNHRNKYGWTPLVVATKYRNVNSVKCLLEAGADVHGVFSSETARGTDNFTALSMLLTDMGRDSSACMEELIRHGAVNSLPERYNGALHLMIDAGVLMSLHLLFTNGMAPIMSDSVRMFSGEAPRPDSPLTVALDRGNIPVIRYLLGNLLLCPCDIYGHSYFSQWRHKLISKNKTDIVTMMDEFYSQPKSLFQLSFVTVSHALGGVPGRVDRVNSLSLPSKIKDILQFKNIDIPVDMEENPLHLTHPPVFYPEIGDPFDSEFASIFSYENANDQCILL